MSFSKVSFREAFWFQEGPGVRKWQFTTSGIKLLNVANIVKDGSINLSKTDRHLSEEEVDSKYSHFLADPGDLVIASSGISIDDDGFLRTRGAFVDKCHLPLCMNTSTIRFKSLNGVSELAYLRHWLQSFEFRSQITREVTGIAQKNFGPSHLKRLRISLPPLAEQKRIAGILDAADALRAKRREALAQLDTLLQSIFLDMFGDPVTNPMGWERKPLGEVIRVRSGDGLVSKDMAPDGKYPVYGGNGINGYHDSFMFESPRIVLGRVGVYCGAVHLTRPRAWVTDNALYVHTFIQPVDTTYLVAALKMANLNQYAGRSAQPLISGNRIYPIEILIPPVDLQRRFATIVESVEQQMAHQRAHLAELDMLFASLQSRAFRGEL